MTSDDRSPIPDETLHKLVDGRLGPDEAARVEALVAADPETAREVAQWRAQNAAIRRAFSKGEGGYAGKVHEGPGSRPSRIGRKRSFGLAVAASLVIAFVLGGGLGYLAGSFVTANGARSVQDGEWLAAEASLMHRTYGREVRHAVEVGADEHDHLVNWLGNRIERDFTAPSLEELGFVFLGGRLVPVAGQPGAMLMYENASGDRATILLARNIGARDTAFQYSHSEGVATLRWIDGPAAYAISGFFEREELENLSLAVYSHFEGRYHPG